MSSVAVLSPETNGVDLSRYGIDPSSITPEMVKELRQYLTPEEQVLLDSLIGSVSFPDMPFNEFIPLSWKVVEPNTPYLHNWHIDAIVEHLEAVVWGQIKNLIINVPPRHMKSTLVSQMWQPWVWSFRPSSAWLCFSHGKGLSTRDNVAARNIIKSRFYQEAFGHVFQLSGDQNLKTRFHNNEGGKRIAAAIGGSTGEGGDFILGDDLLDREDRYSEVKREGANSFWGTTVTTSKNTEQTATVIICQRLHEHDIVGYVREKEIEGGAKYELLVIPCEHDGRPRYTSIGWEDPRTHVGELIWPSRFSRERVDQQKIELGIEQTAAQLQQLPAPPGGDIFRMEWMRFWQPKGAGLPPVRFEQEDGSFISCPVVDLPDTWELQSQSWDMTFKGKADNAFVVGQVWRKTLANLYLMDQVKDKMNLPQTLGEVVKLKNAWPHTTAIWIEDKANGPGVIAVLRNQIAGLIPVEPTGDKIARAHAASPTFQSGNVYFPHPQIAPWVYQLVAELVQFPNSKYNDQVDATTQAIYKFVTSTKRSKKPSTTKPHVVRRDQVFGRNRRQTRR